MLRRLEAFFLLFRFLETPRSPRLLSMPVALQKVSGMHPHRWGIETTVIQKTIRAP